MDQTFYDIVQEVKSQIEEVYAADVLGIDFIFRPILRYEYTKLLQQDLKVAELEEEICKLCVIYPVYDFGKGPAGVAKTLFDLISDVSGIKKGQSLDLLDEYRAQMYDYDHVADVLIHMAFPEFGFDEIKTWPVKKTMFYLSRAEYILSDVKGYEIPMLDTETIRNEMNGVSEEEQQEAGEEKKEETKKTKAKQENKTPTPEEADVLNMLQQKTGRQAKTENEMDLYPELSWFAHEDKLKGEFD